MSGQKGRKVVTRPTWKSTFKRMRNKYLGKTSEGDKPVGTGGRKREQAIDKAVSKASGKKPKKGY